MPQAPLGCQIDITKPTSTCSSVAGSVGGGGHGRGSGHWRVDNARWPTWSPPPARKARQAAGLGGRARWRPLSRGTEAGRPAEPGWCSPSGRPWLARGLTTGTLCRFSPPGAAPLVAGGRAPARGRGGEPRRSRAQAGPVRPPEPAQPCSHAVADAPSAPKARPRREQPTRLKGPLAG